MGKLLELPDGEMRAGVATCGDLFAPRPPLGRGVGGREAHAVPRRRGCAGYPRP
jgi:hypothetical protein